MAEKFDVLQSAKVIDEAQKFIKNHFEDREKERSRLLGEFNALKSEKDAIMRNFGQKHYKTQPGYISIDEKKRLIDEKIHGIYEKLIQISTDNDAEAFKMLNSLFKSLGIKKIGE